MEYLVHPQNAPPSTDCMTYTDCGFNCPELCAVLCDTLCAANCPTLCASKCNHCGGRSCVAQTIPLPYGY